MKNTVWKINCSCFTTYDWILFMYFMLQNQRFITTHYLSICWRHYSNHFKLILFIFLYTFAFLNSIITYFCFSWVGSFFSLVNGLFSINASTLFWYFSFSITTNVFPLSAFIVKYRFSWNFFDIDFIVLSYWFFFYYTIILWYFGFVFVVFICTLVF